MNTVHIVLLVLVLEIAVPAGLAAVGEGHGTAARRTSSSLSTPSSSSSSSRGSHSSSSGVSISSADALPAATQRQRGGGSSGASRRGSSSASAETNAEQCVPPAVAKAIPSGVPIKPLPPGEKPNFIIILTDDQGYDDIGLHNPSYVKTPNLDRFMRRALRFDNFYVSPQCAQSRAALLTGRASPRVGTMLVHGGYDFINSAEATAAEVMSAAGYNSVHYGKWHNGRTLGYEPWNVGFSESWLPPMASEDALVSHNGTYVQTKKYLDEMLMDNVLGFLTAQQNASKPFYMFYAPHSIHTSRTDGPFQGRAFRLYPQRYRLQFKDPRYQSVTPSTIDAWAMLQYLDDVLGRLFSFLESSPLGRNTYVMIMSDNGPQLLVDEKEQQERRIPSKMQGSKSLANEAGIRNFLAVAGPGVPGGVIDSSLIGLPDILPTMADLASVPEGTANHKPWDGMSFKNLLQPGSGGGAVAAAALQSSGRRGAALASAKQFNRFVFALSPHCWDADAVPALGPDREVLRPQPLLDYDRGGVANSVYWKLLPGLRHNNPGFEACIAVRHREYKWLGATGKVYRFQNESHVELPCNEVPEPQASTLANIMSNAARAWWQSLVADSSSFTKPTYYLGMGKWRVTNMLADGAHERTPGNITLLANGAAGFRAPGDRMCFKSKVLTGGSYDATMFYTSKQWAVFRLSIGTYKAIQDGSAPFITTTLPAVSSVMRGQLIGSIKLPASGDDNTEACLELLNSASPGAPVFKHFANIRFTRRAAAGEGPPIKPAPIALSAAAFLPPTPEQWAPTGTTSAPNNANNDNSLLAVPAPDPVLSEPPPGLDTHGAPVATPAPKMESLLPLPPLQPGQNPISNLFATLRSRYKWPEGQGVMESMFSPFDAEDIDMCEACKPEV
ncbi:hypothetical protein OEZ85_014256 [Tetradesmus obliquus]|uniref:Sulfatase N-terminal domain-containing protein n=1 Tax=Tetradesmus obliquus TaxID=3088 RepID=A0ABY8U7U8_TETOB|nr:hypothetical protein OEZ85_014256 [Tetradesmus obliquus]